MPNSDFSDAFFRRSASSRRRFLQLSAAAFSAVALSNCAPTSSENSDSADSAPASDKTLYLYTWGDYSSEAIYQQFQQQTGIKIVADVYDSNETMLAKLQAGGGDQYSLIYPSDYMVRQMIDSDLLLKLDPAKLEGFENVMDRWKNPVYDPQAAHSVPFNWGTTGLIYNSKLITAEPEDWNFLWENRKELSGKITLVDDVRETLGMVLKSIGHSYNSTDPAQIEAAYQKLLELKPDLAGFKTYGFEDQLIGGDLAVSMTYSALGNLLPVENSHLKYVIPKSGTSVWTDAMAIPAKAPDPDLAYAWINFILEPENAALAAQELKLSTPNKAAFELLPAEIKSKETLYPTAEMLKNGEGIQPVGKALDLYDKYWTEAKSA
ncbi:MAG: spermidine/putrescine ABC transporter substrate-binding protein [Pegethrix bostrychoides GSE-TBD4-15B]|jgi:spermidine/putrescine transport system substrate-binding protein|uniref:Spermidine/putrescine ABC transporter substrate-binding protein n=1 Tax=Pegethrix bostrychoides GSE-TBD4-15B TaxID=2839662 RepID=A0A951PD68_9CYAN|nr:spermidine/putrescine ABC transporter substrate-binding protein [Pegethrix bostrychoides GSE-TBD4-15B]